MKKVCFDYIERARLDSGFFMGEVCEILGIDIRTWHRWKKQGNCPGWALRLLELHSGRLDIHGWDGWRICQGNLINEGLNPKYYKWSAKDLMMQALVRPDCPCNHALKGIFASGIHASAGKPLEAD